MLAAHVFALALLIQLLVARVGAIHQIRPHQQLELLPAGQQVLQRPGVGRLQLQGLLARLEVQQVVTQRQIEQFALPAHQPILRIEGRHIVIRHHLIRQRRRLLNHRHAACRQAFGSALTQLRRHRRLSTGQRLDPLKACAADIQRHFEIVVLPFYQVQSAALDGVAETRHIRMRRQGGLEQLQLIELHALAQSGNVVDRGAGEFLGLEPDPSKSMPLGKHQERIEAGLLQRGTEEQRQIKAGRQALLRHMAGATHLLPVLLKAGRRQCVIEAHRGDRHPDR
ncbi:hypothetical protein D9M71_295890 [compost metagenome]